VLRMRIRVVVAFVLEGLAWYGAAMSGVHPVRAGLADESEPDEGRDHHDDYDRTFSR